MRYKIIAIFVFILTGCDNDDNLGVSSSPAVQGTWVEVEGRSDTLTFQSIDDMAMLTLARGREFKNGQWVPKSRSGLYQYKLQGTKISLYWMLSSNYSFTEYDFQREENTIRVGNFFNSPLGPSLTFERVR